MIERSELLHRAPGLQSLNMQTSSAVGKLTQPRSDAMIGFAEVPSVEMRWRLRLCGERGWSHRDRAEADRKPKSPYSSSNSSSSLTPPLALCRWPEALPPPS